MITSVQSSTRALIGAFRDKTKLLTNCSDLKLLLREGYEKDIAKQASQKFFRNSKISFVAIDGTESQMQGPSDHLLATIQLIQCHLLALASPLIRTLFDIQLYCDAPYY